MPNITRRGWLAGAAGGILSSCGRRAGSGYDGYVLVATAGENSISVTDLSNFHPLRQVDVGAPSSFIQATANASYVLTPGTGSVHAIDHAFEQKISRRFADQLCDMEIGGSGRRLFALSNDTQELIEADVRTLVAGQRWKLDGKPSQLSVSRDGSVAVSSGEPGIVELVDARTGRVTRREFQGPIGDVEFRRDGKLLLVANLKDQSLTALEVPSLEVVVDLPLAMQPEHLCFNKDGGQLFVTGKGMDGIAIAFPYMPLEIEQTVLAGRAPGAMACSENPAYLMVASASGDNVYILNIDDRKVLGIVEVGKQPGFVTTTPDSQYALVLNEGSGDMAVIRLTSIQQRLGNPDVMRGKSAAALFTMVPVGLRPVHAAIVNKEEA